MKLAGLVAAAGRSERMGRSKALLAFDDDDRFVTHLARVLGAAEASPVVVTLPEPPDDEPVAAALEGLDVVATHNARPADGLAGSLLTALERLPGDVEALAVCPVDAPFVTEDLVRALAEKAERGAIAAVPVVDGAWGHPVVVGRALFDEVLQHATERGLRALLDRHDQQVARVPWHDRRVVENVNTPADYERLFRRGTPARD